MHRHRRHQGRIIGVETTRKPRYLPGNQQFYGTPYGFEADAVANRDYAGHYDCDHHHDAIDHYTRLLQLSLKSGISQAVLGTIPETHPLLKVF
ncbi:MAG: hypothetical protein LC742_08455 [Acidobacteria bacterium]|nr:hypothetical protein [Acidobacteriota bacterium]